MKQNNSYSCVIDDADMANVANANVIEVSTEVFQRSSLGLWLRWNEVMGIRTFTEHQGWYYLGVRHVSVCIPEPAAQISPINQINNRRIIE